MAITQAQKDIHELNKTKVNKYLQSLFTLESILESCLTALISHGLPTKAKG